MRLGLSQGVNVPQRPSGVSAMTPAALIAGAAALNTWQLHCLADLGASVSGGVISDWNDQSGNARHWTTSGAPARPVYTAADSRLGGRASLNGSASGALCMSNPWNPAAPGTTPLYRISVQRMNSYISSRTFSQAGTGRMGLRCNGVPGKTDTFNPTATVPLLPYGERKWVIVEEYYSNSTNDFLRVAGLQASGVNLGNTDPASFGLFSTNAAGSIGDFSCAYYAVGALPADRAALRSLLLSYYGAAYIKTSGGGYRLVMGGDSQTAQENIPGTHGWREYCFDYFDTTLQHFYRSVGLNTGGAWATNDTRHDGVSGQTIAQATAYLAGRYGVGGSVAGAGNVDVGCWCLGAGDVFVNLTTPAQWLIDLENFGHAWLDAETGSKLALCNVPPYPGDPSTLATYNAGIPAVITSLKAAYPGRIIEDSINGSGPIDLFGALGSAYNSVYYIDPTNRHLNELGSRTTCGPRIAGSLAPTLNALAA